VDDAIGAPVILEQAQVGGFEADLDQRVDDARQDSAGIEHVDGAGGVCDRPQQGGTPVRNVAGVGQRRDALDQLVGQERAQEGEHGEQGELEEHHAGTGALAGEADHRQVAGVGEQQQAQLARLRVRHHEEQGRECEEEDEG